MREIKFRGFENYAGNALYEPRKRWLFGDLIHRKEYAKPTFWIRHIEHKYESSSTETKVEDASIGQFTGFKDKNEKEIYEGDILNQCLPGGVGNLIVFWHQAKFVVRVDYNNSPSFYKNLHDVDCHTMEVCGNIYEDTKLSEVKL